VTSQETAQAADWLAWRKVGDATLTIADDDGTVIETFTSAIPADKKDRHGLYITADAGMNGFLWPMTYPSGVKMVDTEFHERPAGPLAVPGTYRATLTVGDWSTTQTFELLKDPRVDTPDADLAEQFALLLRIRDTLSEIATAVNTIRSLRRQIADWIGRLEAPGGDATALAAARTLVERLTAVEAELVQAEFTSHGDTLNYREQLFEKLSALPPVVSSADARPTVQSYAVYDKLAGQATLMLWNPRVSPTDPGDAAAGGLNRVRRLLEPMYMAPVFLLALLGLAWVPRRFAALAVTLLAYQWATAAVFVGATRYRVPWDYIPALLAGAALVEIFARTRRRRGGAKAPPA